MFYFGYIALRFKKPLRQVFIVTGLAPLIIINVQFIFVSISLCRRIFHRFLLSSLAFNSFWLLSNLGTLKVQFLLLIVFLLILPYSQVTNLANIFLNPIQIFACKSFFLMAIVAKNNISFFAIFDLILALSQPEFV